MENKEYLNEEKNQATSKKIRKTGTALLCIGLVMMIGGIILAVSAQLVFNKPMLSAIGAPLIVLGFAFLGVGGQAKLLGNARNINAYFAQQNIPVAQEGMEKMSPSMGKAAENIAKGIKKGLSDDNTVYCKHCGAEIDADSSFCKKCGKQL